MAWACFRKPRKAKWAASLADTHHRYQSTLAFQTVRAGRVGEGDAQVRRGIVIHGLMGAGKNLRPLCKRLLDQVVQHSPSNSLGWELVLVDLRKHGKSAGLGHFRPPHNIQSAANDIAKLIVSESWDWPDVVMGHSYGGKVALEFGESCAHGQYGSWVVPPKQLCILDSIPAKVDVEQTGEMERILTTIRSLPNPVPSHRWLLEKLIEKGFAEPLAIWIGSSMKKMDPSREEMTWIFDVEDIYDMLLSYRQSSYLKFLEHPPKGMNISIVRAENSDRWSSLVISQVEKLVESKQQQERPEQGTLNYHILENSGHWVHVDNPNGLIKILTPYFVNIAAH